MIFQATASQFVIARLRNILKLFSCFGHRHANFDHTSQKPISALNGERRFNTTDSARYDITKPLLERSPRFPLPTVVLNADPGICISELSRSMPPSLDYIV